jgi:hypothetical protein
MSEDPQPTNQSEENAEAPQASPATPAPQTWAQSEVAPESPPKSPTLQQLATEKSSSPTNKQSKTIAKTQQPGLTELRGANAPAKQTTVSYVDRFLQPHTVELQQPPEVSAKQASQERNMNHPGSYIDLPHGGGRIHFQYGLNPTVARNGVLLPELLDALLDRLAVFQSGPMKSRETDQVMIKLEEARMHTQSRQRARAKANVRFTDTPY